MNTEPPYAGLKWAHYLRVMLLVPLDQGTQGNKGRKGISLSALVNWFENFVGISWSRSFEKSHYVYAFTPVCCSATLFFVGSQFIDLNSVAPTCAVVFRFKKKRMHLFYADCIFLDSFLFNIGNHEVWIRAFRSNLRRELLRKL